MDIAVIILFAALVFYASFYVLPSCLGIVSFSGLLKRRGFDILVVAGLATGAALQFATGDTSFERCSTGSDILIISVSILITQLVFYNYKSINSLVASAFGAAAAISFSKHGSLEYFPIGDVLVSLLAAPVAAGVIASAVYLLIRNLLRRSQKSLLIKSRNISLVVALCTFGISAFLILNYILFFDVLFGSAISFSSSMGIALSFVLAAAAGFILLFRLRYMKGGDMDVNLEQLASVTVALFLVMGVFNLGLFYKPLFLSPYQVMFTAFLFVNIGKGNANYKSSVRLLSGTFLNPALAFLLALSLEKISGEFYLSAFFIVAVIVLVPCLNLLAQQRRRTATAKSALRMAETQRTETNSELNKMEMSAINSEFEYVSKLIEHRHKELVDLGLNIKTQRDFLKDVIVKLEDAGDKKTEGEIRQNIKELCAEVKEKLNLDDEMQQFYDRVETLDKNFIAKLSVKCPNLSEQEKKLAILIRLGFSSKEMAAFMNIGAKSIEINRYRFRKKLKLEREDNLAQFIKSI